MVDILYLGSLLWFLMSIVTLVVLTKRENKELQEFVKFIMERAIEQGELLMILDYKSSEYKEIDNMLISRLPEKLIIVFHAPEWLIAVKRKKWAKHCVLDANDLNGMSNYINETVLIKVSDGKSRKYNEVLPFLKLINVEKT